MLKPLACFCVLLSGFVRKVTAHLQFSVEFSGGTSHGFKLEKYENPIQGIRSFCNDKLNSNEFECKQIISHVITVLKTSHGENAKWEAFEGDMLSFGDSSNSKDIVEEWGKKSYHVDMQTLVGGAYSAVLQVPQFQTNIQAEIEEFCQTHSIPGMGCRALSFEVLNFATSLYFREGGATIENIVSGMVFEMDIEWAYFSLAFLSTDGTINTKYFSSDMQSAAINVCKFCHIHRLSNEHCAQFVDHVDEQLAVYYGDVFAGFLHVVQAVLNPEIDALFKSDNSDLNIIEQLTMFIYSHPVRALTDGQLKGVSSMERLVARLRDIYNQHNDLLFSFIERDCDRIGVSEPSVDSSVLTPTAPDLTNQTRIGARRRHYSFAELGRIYGTDKLTHHGYHRFYPRFIEQYRGVPAGQAMLEIGVDQSHSLRMWLEYFPHAFVYGVDIDVAKSGDRFKIFKADQSKLNTMRRIVQKDIAHPLFLIVDDGSHHPEHQVLCFEYLFAAALQPGGTYIIEDIETSYWTNANHLDQYPIKYGYLHLRSVIEVFKALADDVNREFLSERNRRVQDERVNHRISAATRQMVSTITFGHNCIIIAKKTEEEYEYNNRDYRYRILV